MIMKKYIVFVFLFLSSICFFAQNMLYIFYEKNNKIRHNYMFFFILSFDINFFA